VVDDDADAAVGGAEPGGGHEVDDLDADQAPVGAVEADARVDGHPVAEDGQAGDVRARVDDRDHLAGLVTEPAGAQRRPVRDHEHAPCARTAQGQRLPDRDGARAGTAAALPVDAVADRHHVTGQRRSHGRRDARIPRARALDPVVVDGQLRALRGGWSRQ
jgi:hypothetical protein